MGKNTSIPYPNLNINEDTSGATPELSFKFKVTIDLQNALDAFVRYTRLGLFTKAEELYLEMSQGNETCFAIIAERADSLLAQGRYHDLSNFLDDMIKQPEKYSFEEDQQNILRLLEGLVNIYTKGKLREALEAASSWRAAAKPITPHELSALETHSLRVYLHIITLSYANSTFVAPQYTQPPWGASTEYQEPQNQLWSGFIDLCIQFSFNPVDFWDAQALFRLLLPVLSQRQAEDLFDQLNSQINGLIFLTEERLISGLSIRTAYVRHLIASGKRENQLSNLIYEAQRMLDSFEGLVDVDEEFNDTKTRQFLELNLALLEDGVFLATDDEFYSMSHPKDKVQEHIIWKIADRNADLAIQGAFLYTRYLGPRGDYFHPSPDDGLPRHFVHLMGDRMGFLSAMADRILSFYKLSTIPYPSKQSTTAQLAQVNLTAIYEFISNADESDSKNFRELLSVFEVPFIRFKGSLANATGLLTITKSNTPEEILAALPKVVKNLQATIDNNLSKTPWPMHYAADKGYSAMVKSLLEMGVDANVRDIDGRTPLIVAVSNGDAEIAKLLLDSNGYIEARDDDFQTPLVIATKNNNAEMVKLLLDKGGNINASGFNNQTPLIIATKNNNAAMVKLLLDRRADINVRGFNDQTPLIIATKNKNAEMVELLLDRRADINVRSFNNQTPLATAVEKQDIEMVALLLDKGAYINGRGFNNQTPLIIAAKNSNAEMVELLLDRGADINAGGFNGQTPLIIAVENRDIEMVTLLLRRNADATAKDPIGQTPLIIAVANRDLDSVTALLEGHPGAIADDSKIRLMTEAERAGRRIKDLITSAIGSRAGLEKSSKSK